MTIVKNSRIKLLRRSNLRLKGYDYAQAGLYFITICVQNMECLFGNIVGAYKSLVAIKCLQIYKSQNKRMGKLWQRNYYECIIRDEPSYWRVANYIANNPVQWKNDQFNTHKP